MIKIILLDIDGVLIQPGGYRAALRATFNHFIDPYYEIDEETLVGLERRGISSEWDMAPLLLASYWNDILSRQPMQNLPDDVSTAASEISRQRKVDVPVRLSAPDIAIVAGQYPAETAFHLGYFSEIPRVLQKNLLTQTRNVYRSHPMRAFQHFSLGSKKFTETYQLESEFETESLLLLHDTSNINDGIRTRLRQPNHRLAAFTARPSEPPFEIAESIVGYAAEAELGLELAEMTDIPLIAFGKLEYLASKHQLDPATLLKPSPVQALAAILAAWTGQEWPALLAADHWRETGMLHVMFDQLPKTFELIVVEDTMGGIRSTQKAGELLQQAGFDIVIHALGLTSGSIAKKAVFEEFNVRHYDNWTSLTNGIGL